MFVADPVITPFVLSPELSQPADLILPAADFTPPDNKEAIPNLIGNNAGWNWYQYSDFNSATNPVPAVAIQPAALPAATVPDIVNNPQSGDADFIGPVQAADIASNPQPGDADFIGPVAPAANKNSPLLIVAGVIAALYLLNA